MNYLKNSEADIEYSDIMIDVTHSEFAICHTLINVLEINHFNLSHNYLKI